MSNNNNRNQPQQSAPAKVAETEEATEPVSVPLKAAVVLCLNILLRAATYGTVARSNEEPIREAISSLE